MNEYTEITSSEELTRALEESARRDVLFFKHSNSCGVSDRAFREFRKYLETEESRQTAHYLITVQRARPASDELARRLGVQHESPQAILVRDGKAIWTESHLALKEGALIAAVKTAQG